MVVARHFEAYLNDIYTRERRHCLDGNRAGLLSHDITIGIHDWLTQERGAGKV